MSNKRFRMKRKSDVILVILGLLFIAGCKEDVNVNTEGQNTVIEPKIITEKTAHDTDDPAIWVNRQNPTLSFIIGTDKSGDGGLYVFDLNGKIIKEKTRHDVNRPNNVDVEYGFMFNGSSTDIVVAGQVEPFKIRVLSLPEMVPIDDGGIDIFVGEEYRRPMGIAVYKRPSDGAIFVIVSRKNGPSGKYLWQYRLEDDGKGNVTGVKVREFGKFNGVGEIESIAVDDELGYIYYSSEDVGVRKYYADPDKEDANTELALFATKNFAGDREGISIYKVNDGTGYILVSDQQANEFHIYKREGEPDNPHLHNLVKVVNLQTEDSDGSDVTNAALNETFLQGMFVAMSNGGFFHYYSWADIAGDDLVITPNGSPNISR